jgi:hypothetical protein
MKLGTAVSINMKLLGVKFADLRSREQAEFFSGLAQELSLQSDYCSKTEFRCIAQYLNDNEKYTLKNAFSYLWEEAE